MIGAKPRCIDKAEDRERFDQAMKAIGLETPRSAIAHSMEEAFQVQSQLGYPCVIRPSFTLGGSGGGVAYNREEFEEICTRGLDLSPTSELLIDESLLGWKEFEMEVVRDKKDNCIIVCAIENVDPMGVHTGDSITVAPAQTLTDKEYQLMRNASIGGAARNRRRDWRLKCSVWYQSRRWPCRGDRDEPAGVPIFCIGLQGHRLPDRKGRGKTGRGLHP